MKKLTSLALALAILVGSSFIAPKSHALIGLIFRSRVVKVIGGIGSGAGAVLGTAGLIGASASKTIGGVIVGIAGMYWGAIIGGIGLIILEDNSVADAGFAFLTKESAPQYSVEAIAIYNSELEELNAIRKTIASEAESSEGFEASQALWNKYKTVLSPETVEVAEAEARSFIQELNQAN